MLGERADISQGRAQEEGSSVTDFVLPSLTQAWPAQVFHIQGAFLLASHLSRGSGSSAMPWFPGEQSRKPEGSTHSSPGQAGGRVSKILSSDGNGGF